MAQAELQAIADGAAPPAGRPWAQGALLVGFGGAVLWVVLAVAAAS